MSQYSISPRVGHLEALYLIFHFLWKNPKRRLVMDPIEPEIDESVFAHNTDWTEFYGDVMEEDPPKMPEPLGEPVCLSSFVDANHASNVITRRSNSGIFEFVSATPSLLPLARNKIPLSQARMVLNLLP